jgi:hypothetical protein
VPRQDLTGDVTVDLKDKKKPRVAIKVIEPADGSEVASHRPPLLIGKKPGRFVLVAAYEEYRSQQVELEVAKADGSEAELSIEPAAVTLRVGERTPKFRAATRQLGQDAARTIDATFASESPEVLASDARTPAQFEAKAPGKTRIKATVGNRKTWAEITVLDQPFREVKLQPDTVPRANGQFQVVAAVESLGGDADMEYRIVPAEKAGETSWKAATVDGKRRSVQLTSPDLPVGPPGTEYHLMIEARDKNMDNVERYPLDFRITVGGVKVEQQRSKTDDSGADFPQR